MKSAAKVEASPPSTAPGTSSQSQSGSPGSKPDASSRPTLRTCSTILTAMNGVWVGRLKSAERNHPKTKRRKARVIGLSTNARPGL